jgi:hypothetical protein
LRIADRVAHFELRALCNGAPVGLSARQVFALDSRFDVKGMALAEGGAIRQRAQENQDQ